MRTFFQNLIELRDYSPKDEFFTSQEEVDFLTESLELNELSDLDKQNLRDMVVLLYSSKIQRVREENNMFLFDKYNNAMMSITAVIDNSLCK